MIPTVEKLSTQKPQKRLLIRWKTLKGLAAIILFLIITVLIECVVVLYAMNLGVQEKAENRMFGLISPLFHLVPTAVIIALLFSWTYLTRHVAVKPYETMKGKAGSAAKRRKEAKLKETFHKIKSGLLKVKSIAYLWQKIHFARATIKSALTVLLVFSTFILIISLLAYPKLIYQTISGAYLNNPSLLNFVKGTEEALAPIGAIFSAINNALLSAAPSFGNFGSSLGVIIKPLVDLDNAGKYLAFQNVAVWISALAALFYGEYIRKGYGYKKRRS
jgi:hypothetical protein